MTLPSPFLMSWWLDHVAVGSPQFVLVVDGDRLVGGAAFQIRELAGVELVELLGQGPLEPDHLDVVANPVDAVGIRRVTTAVNEWLSRPGSRVISLDGIAEYAHLLDAVAGLGSTTSTLVAPYVPLSDDAAAYLAARPGRVRSTITRSDKRMTKAGVTFRVRNETSTPDEIDAALGDLHRLHDGRWGEASGVTDGWPSFEMALRHGTAAGDVVIHELVDTHGVCIATEVEFVVAARASFYQAGRDTDHEHRGSGSVLKWRVIQSLIANGCTEFDLLRGDEPYKTEWATDHRRLLGVRGAIGARAKVTLAAQDAKRRALLWRHERALRRAAQADENAGDGQVASEQAA